MGNNKRLAHSYMKMWIIQSKKTADYLSGSFWFVPTILIVIFSLAAQLLLPYISVKFNYHSFLDNAGFASATSAMQLVQVIASSIITVTSIAFSMTLVALVMASNSFGPRLIRNFMQNKKTQFVLGFFCASFVFCVIVLSQIRLDEDNTTAPLLAVFVALILGIICVFVLIFFIHHVAISIRADNVVNEIAKSLLNDMSKLQNTHESRVIAESGLCDVERYAYKKVIRTHCIGYVQAIEYDELAELSASYDALLCMQTRAGKYIYPDSEIAYLYSDHPISSDINIDESLVTGSQRTALQDPQFAINQLVEMALRALSPSINDPFTALTCIDKLSAAMASFSETSLPKTLILDTNKSARVLTNEESFEDLFSAAFTPIRQSAQVQTGVICHMLDVFHHLLVSKEYARHLLEPVNVQVEAIKQSCQHTKTLGNKFDESAVDERIARILDAIKAYSVKV